MRRAGSWISKECSALIVTEGATRLLPCHPSGIVASNGPIAEVSRLSGQVRQGWLVFRWKVPPLARVRPASPQKVLPRAQARPASPQKVLPLAQARPVSPQKALPLAQARPVSQRPSRPARQRLSAAATGCRYWH